MPNSGKRRRADEQSLDWLGVLRPSLVANDGRAPEGTVIVRLTAVDSGGFTHFYDEMLVSPNAFAQAMAIFARERVSSEKEVVSLPVDAEVRDSSLDFEPARDDSERDVANVTTLEPRNGSLPDRSNPLHEILGWLTNDPKPSVVDGYPAVES